jgi:hypothetical protein
MLQHLATRIDCFKVACDADRAAVMADEQQNLDAYPFYCSECSRCACACRSLAQVLGRAVLAQAVRRLRRNVDALAHEA